MKKIKYTLSFFFLFLASGYQNLDGLEVSQFEVETKVSAFFPTCRLVREVYSNVIPEYELEIHQSFYDEWQIWLGAGYLGNIGESVEFHNRTTLKLVPVSLGLKFDYPLSDCAHFQAGIGGVWSFLWLDDESHYVHKHVSKNSFGGVFRLGLVFHIEDCFYLDFFSEYFHQRFNFEHHYEEHYTVRNNVDFSGIKAGIGLVLKF